MHPEVRTPYVVASTVATRSRQVAPSAALVKRYHRYLLERRGAVILELRGYVHAS